MRFLDQLMVLFRRLRQSRPPDAELDDRLDEVDRRLRNVQKRREYLQMGVDSIRRHRV